MAEQNLTSIEPLVEEVLQQIYPTLTEGLPPKQALSALDAYRSTILPYRLSFASNEEESERQKRAAIEIEDIVGGLQNLTPIEKWVAVRQSLYVTKLLPLSYAAFDVAQQYVHQARPKEELRQEAQDIDARLGALIEEMREHDPEMLESLEELISETVMDCSYVINDLDIVSLRLKHVIDSERNRDGEKPQASSTCPNCGTMNPPGSHFCNQCGHRLVG
jgi:hypothetical protein